MALLDLKHSGPSVGHFDQRYVNVTGDTMAGQLFIDGSSDQIQLRVQGHSTQTTNLTEWQNSSGAVVGAMSGGGRFSVGATTTTNATFRLVTNQSANTTYSGMISDFETQGSSNITNQQRALYLLGTNTNTATVSSWIGFLGDIANSSTGTITTAIGLQSAIRNTSTGTITTGEGIRVNAAVNSGGGSVGTVYGLRVLDQTVGTTNYAIYTNAGAVYFGDTTTTNGHRQMVSIKSANYTLTDNDEVVVFTATATATLPAATGTGQTYRIVCRAGTLTIDGNGSETVKGELTQTLIAGEDLIITDTASGVWE